MTRVSSGAQAAEPAGSGTAEAGAVLGLAAIVMAAGLGKRMRSKLAKVLHPVAGRPAVRYAVELAERVAGAGVVVVVGHQGDRVRAALEGPASSNGGSRAVRFVEQGAPLGTGHAVLQARRAFPGPADSLPEAFLILNGDTPLLTESSLRELYRTHVQARATVTVLTAVMDDPAGYGRIVRGGSERRAGAGPARPDGPVLRIVEDRDAAGEEADLEEVNVGSYLVDGRFLFDALEKLEARNAQGEYYLTDLVAGAVERGLRVAAAPLAHPEEGVGINSRRELAEADRLMRRRLADRWMDAGVTLYAPETVRIDADVTLGRDTVVHPFVTLEGRTRIGEDCVIRSHARLTDCRLGDRVTVLDACVLREATLEDGATIGPFAHLRPGAVVRRDAKVGNFVEMKQADLGEGSKANHLTYLGDARIGRRVNIGAGTVTCNYDGANKHPTVIEDDVFVGSDALLVAPVTVGKGALIAAGSTITEDVPPDALAIGRAPQMNRPGWAARRRAMQKEEGLGVRGAGRGGNEHEVGLEARGSRQGAGAAAGRLTGKRAVELTGKNQADRRAGKKRADRMTRKKGSKARARPRKKKGKARGPA